MERLTRKDSAGYDLIKMNDEYCTTYCNNQPVETCSNCAIYEAIHKLSEYENCLLEPNEVKELVLDICKGNHQRWNKRLSQLLHDNYENAEQY